MNQQVQTGKVNTEKDGSVQLNSQLNKATRKTFENTKC